MFLLLSCSDSEESIPQQTAVPQEFLLVDTVRQTTYYSSTDYETSVTNFTYENERLTGTLTTNGPNVYGAEYSYENGKISAVQYTQNGASDGLTTFVYNGNQLNYTLSGENQDERTNYTFSNGHLATVKTYYPDGPDASLLQSSSYVYTNGNMTEELRQTYFFSNETSRFVYSYDNKNNPFSGLDATLKLVLSNEGFNGLSAANPVLREVYNPSDETTPQAYHYEMEYNDAQYPVLIKRYSSNNVLISETQITYQ